MKTLKEVAPFCAFTWVIISINSTDCVDLIRPNKINYSSIDWRKLPDNQMEFYLDYETTTDFIDLNFIFMIGVGYIDNKNKGSVIFQVPS